jgi:hypothetical protein
MLTNTFKTLFKKVKGNNFYIKTNIIYIFKKYIIFRDQDSNLTFFLSKTIPFHSNIACIQLVLTWSHSHTQWAKEERCINFQQLFPRPVSPTPQLSFSFSSYRTKSTKRQKIHKSKKNNN